jgi:hypothetical protein
MINRVVVGFAENAIDIATPRRRSRRDKISISFISKVFAEREVRARDRRRSRETESAPVASGGTPPVRRRARALR